MLGNKNTILNPAPLSKEAQSLQRQSGKANFPSSSASQAGSLIFPTSQETSYQPIKSSIQITSPGTKYHHHSSQILMQDYDPSLAAASKQMSEV